jgi:hypothetical protein
MNRLYLYLLLICRRQQKHVFIIAGRRSRSSPSQLSSRKDRFGAFLQ